MTARLVMAVAVLLATLVFACDARAESGCPEIIVATFGERSGKACAVAYCETGGTYDNSLIGQAGEVSIFQVHPVHFGYYSRQRLIDDEEYATMVAFDMSNGGRNWSAWTCG